MTQIRIPVIQTEQALRIGERLNISFLPERMTSRSAGADLKACIDYTITIRPKEVVKIPLGIKVYLDGEDGACMNSEEAALAGIFLLRSSNKHLKLTNTVGLLDADFQDEAFLKIENTSDEDNADIHPGDRIGQLLIVPAVLASFYDTGVFENDTDRLGGDGSTGGNWHQKEDNKDLP